MTVLVSTRSHRSKWYPRVAFDTVEQARAWVDDHQRYMEDMFGRHERTDRARGSVELVKLAFFDGRLCYRYGITLEPEP